MYAGRTTWSKQLWQDGSDLSIEQDTLLHTKEYINDTCDLKLMVTYIVNQWKNLINW